MTGGLRLVPCSLVTNVRVSRAVTNVRVSEAALVVLLRSRTGTPYLRLTPWSRVPARREVADATESLQ